MSEQKEKPLWRRAARQVAHAGVPVPRVMRPVVAGLYRLGVGAVELCAVLRKIFWVEPVLRSVCESVGTHLRAERLPYMRGRGQLRLGHHVNLSGRSCFYFIRDVGVTPRIDIGDHSFVGNGCTFSAGSRISVGAHCLISALVRIHDNDGHPLDAERRRRGDSIGDNEVAPVVIGDNVWVGASATILKGVTVGDNAVIGTGAVVTSDVAANTIVAGNPAHVVKTLS